MRDIKAREAKRVAAQQERLDALRPVVIDRPQKFITVRHQDYEVMWDGT